ncbi:MAG: DNA mismatch repair protein MutS [Clostridia bacterium]|nr:DNA mismatch repair protein MutS [Clostridia bacterium]
MVKLEFVENNEHLKLDINAVKNLELVKTQKDGKRYGSLLWALDKTCTSMGARTLNSWILSPLQDIEKINGRLDGVSVFFDNVLLRQTLTELLNNIRDLGRLTGKISNGNLMPRDVLAIGESLNVLPSIKFQLSGIEVPLIKELTEDLGDFAELSSLLKSAINPNLPTNMKDGGYIADGFDKELDDLREIGKNGVQLIKDLAEREREKTGIRTLKVDYNRVFGYYIEVTNSFKNAVPYEYVRKQTLVNAERYITEELKELEEKILTSSEKAIKLESAIFNKIKTLLLSKIDLLIKASTAIGVLDALNSLATVAKENNYVRPKMQPLGSDFNVVEGRHPIVELLCKERFVSNNACFDKETTAIVLTGPNMAGKSTYMRQVALITIMAHMGSFVPAKSAEIPIIDKVFTRIGASDNLILDQSTFMVEMSEMANILNNATENSLIIVDELGRGTSTYDGLSIAWAVLEYLVDNIKAKTLFATHYHELVELENLKPNVKNYKVTVKEIGGDIVFMRKIVRGGASRSFGIEVASLAGIKQDITKKAKTVLKQLESSKNIKNDTVYEETVVEKTEVEKILERLDLNSISPIQAFQILVDLKDKI